jgi:hypothetical protein
MNNNVNVLLEIKSQLDELKDKIYDYKKVLREKLEINKLGFEENLVNNNIEELQSGKDSLIEIVNIEKSAM